MRTTTAISAALLASSAAAAPISVGSWFNKLVTGAQSDLNNILNGLHITQRANASAHGAVLPFNQGCPGPIEEVIVKAERFAHDITWPLISGGNFINWKTYKANGANLGSWLEKERSHDPDFFLKNAPAAGDEWTVCQTLGDKCGAAFEESYATFLNTSTIDKLASVGVNTLRIPTTYAAWVQVPGSALYHGNQQKYLRTITQYAIERYNMHIIVGLHNLPGGINGLDIGEAYGHQGWFYNATNLDYSFQAVDAVLNFMKTSGHLNSFTFYPLNEAADNLAGFGGPDALSEKAVDWVLTYMDGVFKKVEALDKRIPVMLQDCFKGPAYWAPLFDASKNLVLDTHIYYNFAPVASADVLPVICSQAASVGSSESKFPIFVGEWSLQTSEKNVLANRKGIFETQRYAWQKNMAGGAFWSAVSYANAAIDGEGAQLDYWSYARLIDQGVITKQTTASYC